MRIWGRLNSINVQKVVWCARELGLAFERIDAGGPFGRNDTPEYRTMNPNGLVPVLEEEDGFVLWESNAIVRYLAALHGSGRLWPEDPRARALADRWMDWQATAFTPAIGPAFMGLVRTAPAQRDEAAIGASLERGERFAAIADAHLAGHAFMGGDDFTMADVAVGCVAHRWLNLPAERAERPALRRWYERVRARPAAAEILTDPIT